MSFWKKLENILRLNTNFGVITTKAHNVLHEVAQGIWFLCLKKTMLFQVCNLKARG